MLVVSNAIIAVPKHFSSSRRTCGLLLFLYFPFAAKERKKVSLYSLSLCAGLKMLFSYFSASKVNNKQTAINKIVAVSTPRPLTPRFHFISLTVYVHAAARRSWNIQMSSNVRVTGSRGHFDFSFLIDWRAEKNSIFFQSSKNRSHWIFIFQISSENERGTRKENDDDDDCNAPFSFSVSRGCRPRARPWPCQLQSSNRLHSLLLLLLVFFINIIARR